jgi:putative transposase
MIRIVLTSDMRQELLALRRDPSFSPGERDRVEMLMLSAEGWSPPRIASHLGCHPKTVRLALKGFLAEGTGSLRHHRPGPVANLERKERITRTLDSLLGQERTWTAAQLAEALSQEGYPLSTRQTRKYLKAMGAKWRRTVRTLAHKQDEQKVERARTQLSALKKRPLSGDWS